MYIYTYLHNQIIKENIFLHNCPTFPFETPPYLLTINDAYFS